jgi:glycosyltransferase involved in cell wall biosynthesis
VPTGRWAEQAGAVRLAPSTPEAFSKATQELLSMPEQLEAMGRRGQAFAREQFDIQVVARQTLAQYKEILISGRPLLTE